MNPGNGLRPKAVWLLIAAIALAAPASSQNLKVTLLGTGAPRPVMERFGPSILVEAGKEKLLFDCGRGATMRLYQLKAPFADLNALFLTHLHSDHIVGISDFYLTGWILGRSTPLRVWGPAGTADMMSHLQEAYQFDIHVRRDVDEMLPAQGVVVVAKDIEQGVVYQNGDLKVTAFTVDHAPIKPAFGYRIDYGGHSVVLSGDTRYNENLIHFAKGADVLIHEVIDPEAFRGGNAVFNPELNEESNRAPHHRRTGRNDFQPGKAQAGGLFAHCASECRRPGGADAQNLFRAARSGRRPDEYRDWGQDRGPSNLEIARQP